MRKKNIKREVIFWAAVAVFLAATAITGVEFYHSLKSESDFDDLRRLIKNDTCQSTTASENTEEISSDYIQNTKESLMSELTTTFEQTKEQESVTEPTDKEAVITASPKVILEKYSDLYALNNHLVGWLKIEGTVIDYPVLEVEGDNDYYLSHDFYGNESRHGQIILDYHCDFEDQSTNMILHGHHMADGSMFGGLKKYRKLSYYKKHKYIRFDTVYEEGIYEIFAVFLSKVYYKDDNVFKYYNFIQADTEEAFDSYVASVKTLSLYDTGVTPAYGDKLIALSTCEYSQDNGRIVVAARKLLPNEVAELE